VHFLESEEVLDMQKCSRKGLANALHWQSGSSITAASFEQATNCDHFQPCL